MDELVKERLLEHNTFVRGVRDEEKYRAATNIKLQQLGLEPTAENRMKYYATHYTGRTGHGRAGVTRTDNTTYTSNSFDTGYNYATVNPGETPVEGMMAIVRRPVDFSGNRRDWVRNADFTFKRRNDPKSSNFYNYVLPYLLKTGNMPPEKVLNQLDYDVINSKVGEVLNRQYGISFQAPTNTVSNARNSFNRTANEGYKEVTQRYYNNLDRSLSTLNNLNKELGSNIIFPHSRQLGSPTNGFYNRVLYNYFSKISERLSRDFNVDTPEGSPEELIYNSITGMGWSNMTLNDIKDYLGNSQYQKAISNIRKVAEDVAKNDFNPHRLRNARNRYIKNMKDNEKKLRRKLINERKQYTREEYEKLLKDNGIEPFIDDTNVITTEPLRSTSRNIGDPYQHFIFIGPEDDKSLDLVKAIDPKEYNREQLELNRNMGKHTRAHVGKYTPGLSRKSRRYGGLIRPYLSNYSH